MEAMVDQAMQDGAFGLSSALIYVPGSFAQTDELVALAKVAAKYQGIYITHIRGESFNLFNALDEAIGIGRDAGLPVVIFHLKVGAKANWGRMNEALDKIEQANRAGVRVTATMYPYTAGGTGLAATLAVVGAGGRPRADAGAPEGSRGRASAPAPRSKARSTAGRTCCWRRPSTASRSRRSPKEIDQSIIGKRIAQIAAERKADPWEVYFQLLIESGGRIGALYHMMSEADVTTGLRSPLVTIGTDSSALRREGALAPGLAASARLRHVPARARRSMCARTGVMTLTEAVSRMTGAAAQQMGITDRGLIASRHAGRCRGLQRRRPSRTTRPTSSRTSTRPASST